MDRKEYYRQWRAKHPGRNAESCRQWKQNNPDYFAEGRKEYSRKWRLEHPGYYAEVLRRWTLANPGKHYQQVKAWIKANPEKYKAHQHVQRALKRGDITRLPCETCGEIKTHAHHSDYAKPLEVTWLCATCHRRQHPRL